jgi:hypothetical protein
MESRGGLSRGRFIKISLLAWIAFLAIDVLVHGGLLADWYARGSPALLTLAEAFARIPLGYLSFLLLVVLIVWLGSRLDVLGAAQGLILGISVGSLLAAAHGLALVSITTIDPALILWWSVAEAIELTVVGGIVGHALASDSLWRLGALIAIGVLASLAVTVALQNL